MPKTEDQLLQERTDYMLHSALVNLARANQKIAVLNAALDTIPVHLMLSVGPPYTVNLTYRAVKQIAAALEGATQ